MIARMISKLIHRFLTAGELLAYVAGKRPWMVPVLIGLLMMSGFVTLAQAGQISPFIYMLF